MPRLLFRCSGETTGHVDTARSSRVNELLRELTPEGRAHADRIGQQLRDASLSGKALILCAPAPYHIETAERVSASVETPCHIAVLSELMPSYSDAGNQLTAYLLDDAVGPRISDAPPDINDALYRFSIEALEALERFTHKEADDHIIIGNPLLNVAICYRHFVKRSTGLGIPTATQNLRGFVSSPKGGFDIDLPRNRVTFVELE